MMLPLRSLCWILRREYWSRAPGSAFTDTDGVLAPGLTSIRMSRQNGNRDLTGLGLVKCHIGVGLSLERCLGSVFRLNGATALT